jgi:hypothetical protein
VSVQTDKGDLSNEKMGRSGANLFQDGHSLKVGHLGRFSPRWPCLATFQKSQDGQRVGHVKNDKKHLVLMENNH